MGFLAWHEHGVLPVNSYKEVWLKRKEPVGGEASFIAYCGKGSRTSTHCFS
ncbi:MAG: hypothetical protein ACK50V_02235 [Alphaproteobacteria bacterium]